MEPADNARDAIWKFSPIEKKVVNVEVSFCGVCPKLNADWTLETLVTTL